MKNLKFAAISLVAIMSVAAAGGEAAAQKLHATYKDWKVFTHKKSGENFCYIASVPVKKAGNYSRRSEPFAMVTYRKNVADEFSVSSGYPYKKGSYVKVEIDGKPFQLFVDGERAWAFDEEQDKKMAEAIKKGNKMTVRGTSKKGTYSVDTYSLSGTSKAISKMRGLCK